MNYFAMGERIRFFRRKKHLTQEQLAELTDMSASFLGHIERGTRVASIDSLMKLCCVLEVTPNDLLSVELAIEQSDFPELVTISPAELMQNIALLLRKQENP